MSGSGGGAETPAAAEAAPGAGGPRRDGPAHLVIKDLGEIHSRLLDHRPVIQGETRYFLKEFEEKRGLRELRALEKLQSVIGETSEQTLPTCAHALRDLGPVLQRLAAASEAADRLQRREQQWRRVQQEHCSAREQLQARRRDGLWQEQRGREAAVDAEQERARARLQAQYARMEQELGRFAAF
ncbi:biogenesis of lysosome-related organelles complex 1 subunit 5 [Sorex araneus]|uniref:biogenesis of lysosome-related organelles complex 1 subunit 5 n=1 Tax=Sorex araneus TaxID=42254 RepID=UPI0024334B59|nr:biogenesis of lysosome-related organelles complex 1 subunit 5 [Sorex araneus]